MEFVRQCSSKIRSDFAEAVSLLDAGEKLLMPQSRSLANIYPGLHELRLRDHAGQARVFYYIKKGDAIYMIHAFAKKTQRLPKQEIQVTLKRMRRI
ncbi:MAG: type II toxin-antitoxin system RelE/ParE family toxin [Myxococcota bacterium]